MKKITILTFLLVLGVCTKVAAQDAATLLQRATQQYVLYESERDKGTDPVKMYSSLLDSYNLFVKVLEAPNNEGQLTGAKNRLRAIYPQLLSGAIYYSQQKQPLKFLEQATAYIELPKLKDFRDELLERDEQYPGVLYNTALGYFNLKQYAPSVKYFNEFLTSGMADEVQAKNCYVYLNQAYYAQKDYVKQGQILEEAIAKYPMTLAFYYHQVNLYMRMKNNEKLSSTIDRILAIDPNDGQVLPIKAKLLRDQGRNMESLELCKRLYALHPDDYVTMTNLARTYYNVGDSIMASGKTVVSDSEYAQIYESASEYLLSAKDLFEKILEKKPTEMTYMRGLAGVYQYLKMDAEYNVLLAMADEKVSYMNFPSRLAEYNEIYGRKATNSSGQVITDGPLKAPKLIVYMDENSFHDANGNKVIDANERFDIRFTIRNEGEGDAYNLRLRLSEEQGYETFFDGLREKDGGHIPVGTSKEYTFTYIAKRDLPTAKAKINIYAFEQNGFDAPSAGLNVQMQELAVPRLTIADYQFEAKEGSAIRLGSNGTLKLALQNLGAKTAKKIRVNFKLPANVFETDVPASIIDSLAPGDVKTFEYSFLVNNRFEGDSVAVLVDINEDTRSSSINETYKVKLGDYLTSGIVTTIAGEAQVRPEVIAKDFKFGLQSELLENMPVGASHPHRYALIIGNEDYSSVGANAEVNVPYADADAAVFREYCERTFGIPHENIRIFANATVGLMIEQLDWLVNMGKTDPEAELFFYYSGHGNNDDATKEAYLLPVDITGKNVKHGLKLDDLYSRLSELSIKGAYVFLDACFSGGYKSSAPLFAAKGVRSEAKVKGPYGHALSFASSSGDQTSSVFHEKQQGYYTYYLLKTLKDAGGNLTMREWFQKTYQEVRAATAKTGKLQEPKVMVDNQDWPGWGTIKLMTQP